MSRALSASAIALADTCGASRASCSSCANFLSCSINRPTGHTPPAWPERATASWRSDKTSNRRGDLGTDDRGSDDGQQGHEQRTEGLEDVGQVTGDGITDETLTGDDAHDLDADGDE